MFEVWPHCCWYEGPQRPPTLQTAWTAGDLMLRCPPKTEDLPIGLAGVQM